METNETTHSVLVILSIVLTLAVPSRWFNKDNQMFKAIGEIRTLNAFNP